MNNDIDLDIYFRQTNTDINTISEELKKECLLEFDNFNQPKTTEDLKAVANLINTLVIMQPGTYQDSPEMGIGIENYEFEMLNANTIDEIKNRINTQIKTYLPTVTLKDLIVKNFTNDSIRNTLGIGFDLSLQSSSSFTFFLLLQELPDTRKIISQIVY